MGVLHVATAGSVDDGKSTLIGRLLYDSRSLFEDQLASLRDATRRRGGQGLDLALLTDGLRAEREQGITIDVAYRYFTTARRKFVLADCPGHVEYTRNMVTGASTATAAIILVDVTRGVQEQTRRHCFVTSLLRMPYLVVCVNKMDLVEYEEARFRAVERELSELAQRLHLGSVLAIPISALRGDNVVVPSEAMPWYEGPSLLDYLESIDPAEHLESAPLRVPIQHTILSAGYRGYAGCVASGVLSVGEEVVVLPSGRLARVAALELGGSALSRAAAPAAVTVRLEDPVDVARGDMLAAPQSQPLAVSELSATLCWMGRNPLSMNRQYLLQHTTAQTPALVTGVSAKLDVRALEPRPANGRVALNDLVRVRIKTGHPICIDAYRENRATGSFILIDEMTYETVAAGMIE